MEKVKINEKRKNGKKQEKSRKFKKNFDF